jgi:hypothetical protein
MKMMDRPFRRTRLLSIAVIFVLLTGLGCQDQSSLSPSPKSPKVEAAVTAAKYVQTNRLPGEDLPIAWFGDPSKPFNESHRDLNQHAPTARKAAQRLGMPTGSKASFLDCSGESPEMNCRVRKDRGVQSILILITAEVGEESAEVVFRRLLETESRKDDGDFIPINGLSFQEYHMSLQKDGDGWRVTEFVKAWG